jgi:hypothetical protein
MTNEQAFMKFRRALIDAILSDPDYKKVKAFGEFENFIMSSQSYRIEENRFTQYGTPYTPSLDFGRGKNNTNSGGLRASIYEWLGLKKYGIDYSDDKERTGISYAIAKTIAKKGSFKHRNKSAQTRIIEKAIDKTLPSLLKDLAMIDIETQRQNLIKVWQLA